MSPCLKKTTFICQCGCHTWVPYVGPQLWNREVELYNKTEQKIVSMVNTAAPMFCIPFSVGCCVLHLFLYWNSRNICISSLNQCNTLWVPDLQTVSVTCNKPILGLINYFLSINLSLRHFGYKSMQTIDSNGCKLVIWQVSPFAKSF